MDERWYGGWLRFRVLLLLVYVLFSAVVFLLTDTYDVILGSGFLVILPVVYLAILRGTVRREAARMQRRSTPHGESMFRFLPGGDLRRSGLRHIEIRVDDGRMRSLGHTIRIGDRALIVVPNRWDVLPSPVLRGLLLHEAGHLVRNDADRQRWLTGLGLSAVLASGAAGVAPSTSVGLLVVWVVGVVAHNWWSELAADDFLRRRPDASATEAFASYLLAAERTWWQRVRGGLTHPPDRWRAERLRGVSGDDAAAQHGALR